MTVVSDIQTRIAAISQLLTAITPTTPVDGSASFSSALSAALGDEPQFQPVAAASVTGEDVVTDARRYLGVPYVYGGTDPQIGLDCSALVQRVYADLGIDLPRTSQEQATVGVAVPDLAHALPGDLVCFGEPATHIGIYIGDGKMIVAPHTGTVVQIQDITTVPSTIRRVLPASNTSLFSASVVSGAAALDRPAAFAPGGPAGPYVAEFADAEQRYGLPPGLLAAVAKVESNFRPDAVSSAGAIGLMQLMPDTAAALGVDPRDPIQAIDGAARLLAGELQKYGSLPLALAAYNAGGPAVDRYGGIPPYPETQNYVRKVLTTMNEGL